MNVRILRVAVLLPFAAASLGAQTAQVGGPVIGFVYDSSVNALRPVQGIPGASTLGDPLDVGFASSLAFVAPRQDSAIAIASDGSLHLLRLSSGAAEVRCAACPSTAEAAVFSPSGSAVALYSAGRVQVVTGLPDAPTAGASFEVGAMPGAAVGRKLAPPIALSDDGAWLLAATRVSVDLFHANGGPSHLLQTQPYALVAFAAGSHDAAISDPVAGLVLVHDVTAASNQQPLAAPGAIRRPSALAFSADGTRLLVASPTDQSVASIDVSSGANTAIACGCTPSSLVAMGQVLRLNELGNGPLWLLDPNPAQPRVVFVPATAPVQQ